VSDLAAQQSVEQAPLEGVIKGEVLRMYQEVADHPEPRPPLGGRIVHPQGDGTSDAGAGVPRPACSVV